MKPKTETQPPKTPLKTAARAPVKKCTFCGIPVEDCRMSCQEAYFELLP